MYNNIEHELTMIIERRLREKEWARAEKHNHYPAKKKERRGLYLIVSLFRRKPKASDVDGFAAERQR